MTQEGYLLSAALATLRWRGWNSRRRPLMIDVRHKGTKINPPSPNTRLGRLISMHLKNFESGGDTVHRLFLVAVICILAIIKTQKNSCCQSSRQKLTPKKLLLNPDTWLKIKLRWIQDKICSARCRPAEMRRLKARNNGWHPTPRRTR